MDLPDCPPGAEGYQDVATAEVPKKSSKDLGELCTKAELEFQEHLKSLKIKIENGSTRCMVEKRGRDVSGKWIYLCYPCAAVCSGEAILQTHISGKKHKNKLSMRPVWPQSIFDEHPYIVNEKGGVKNDGKSGGNNSTATDVVLKKMAKEVDLHNNDPSNLEIKYSKYRVERCHIQDSLDSLKAPLLGVEYLIEHPPEEAHHEPTYICVLCSKQGHPRTIVNHLTCFWHRFNYLIRHYPKASEKLTPYRNQNKYREGVNVIMNRLSQRIEDKYGRQRPVHIDKEEYVKDQEQIKHWLFKQKHYSEQDGATFEEVVDVDLITSLHRSNEQSKAKTSGPVKDPSPPVVAVPNAKFNSFTRSAGRQQRRAGSPDNFADMDELPRRFGDREIDRRGGRGRYESGSRSRYEPYPDKHRESPPSARHRFTNKSGPDKEKEKPRNYEYKIKLAEEKRKQATESANNTLAYHEKNPEKHPMYPEEWKKFWNRRYKEIQAEGKEPSKHDFKPEWIVFWTARMKELHEEELRNNLIEIYRKLNLSPSEMSRKLSPQPKAQERISKSQERRRSPDRRARRSPEHEIRKRYSPPRRPEPRRPEPRRRSPETRRERRSPEYRRSPPPRRHLSPPPHSVRSRSPVHRLRSPPRTNIVLDSMRRSRSRSPLSRRDHQLRNNSPQHHHQPPAMQTVMISDDELKPEDNLSPWNSDNDIDSLGSLPDARSPPRSISRSNSLVSHASKVTRHNYPTVRGADPQDLGPPENVVATLRLLVALEDYLGSIGPKVVDLMTEAIKMEKDVANSSEELLERESALVLIETAKEKLKGAAQAGLVAAAAANAVRTAVVRAAATLHAADLRAKRKQQSGFKTASISTSSSTPAVMPVAGVGQVDRAQIAQQMAAALIAQGKTDVSSEELAQLVDAVVGMAEAKKREAEVKKKVEARAMADKQARPANAAPTSGTASALQMLQSAYDETDKKVPDKEDVPDAMDGLSDSDLETLLKNFNELSAEEQHSLIAYLKKLEAKEPKRVEKLRQYVSTAAASAPKPTPPKPVQEVEIPATPDKSADVKPVVIESDDDDDYTVEEVFQSATKKVKEDQIRQEMEIVKKSLQEFKATPREESPKVNPGLDLINMSSATDLFALVQASIQATSAASQASKPSEDIITTNTHLRSFGDAPEPAASRDDPSADFDSRSRDFDDTSPDFDNTSRDFDSTPQNFDKPSPDFEESMDIESQYDDEPLQNNPPPVSNMPQHNMINPGGFRSGPNQMPSMVNEPYVSSWNDNQMPNEMASDPFISPWEDKRAPVTPMGMNNMARPMGGNFAPTPFSQEKILNGNMQNNSGLLGNMGGNSNYDGPNGNFGSIQGNLGGNRGPGGFGGNQASFGGNQSSGGFGGNQGAGFGGDQGAGFGGNQGAGFGGKQGAGFGGNQGAAFGGNQGPGFSGNQGSFGGNQGPGFGGNQGSFGGKQGPGGFGGKPTGFGGNQGNFGGNPGFGSNQGSYGGKQGGFGGNQGNFGGNQGNFGGNQGGPRGKQGPRGRGGRGNFRGSNRGRGRGY